MSNAYQKLAKDWYELTESVLNHDCYAVQDAKNNCSLRNKGLYRAAFHAAEVPAAWSNAQETGCL